ncbi:Holliday junction branch migration protein RuvA [Nakamurella sp. A5-74]|uniref:Holliday junction branch migration complex subunit RuvA n=1 Tax=Nakamurella sp. A5-74 TaxID=3158264 RepID=A0AAU8DKN0_9ACTN
MIASLRGVVESVALDHVVLDIGGVGYSVRATPATLATLRRGEKARLATTLVVREDSMTVFGFVSDDARDLFELVQSVSGVGPKIALALLAVLDPDDLRRALSTGDTAALTRAPGIGKKGAERLVLELKDRVGAMPRPGAGLPAGVPAGWRDQLVDALGGLGFPAKQALDVVETVAADGDDPAVVTGDVQVLLRRALSLLARSR